MKIRLEVNVAAGNPLKNRLGGARRKGGKHFKKEYDKSQLEYTNWTFSYLHTADEISEHAWRSY